MTQTPSDSESDGEPEEIIHDLESLRRLLAQEQSAAADTQAFLSEPPSNLTSEASEASENQNEPNTSPSIPTLNDTFEPKDKTNPNTLTDATIQGLLDDAWQEKADALLAAARQTIESHSTQWQPTDTDDLNHALKIRIDKSVREWLGQVLQSHIHTLRQHIVQELAEELALHLNKKLGNPNNPIDTGKQAQQKEFGKHG